MFCNRGIYHNGWSAVTRHSTPWEMSGQTFPAFDDDVWELYDGNVDWTQSNDLSDQNPEKLHELQRLWLIEAVKYNVLPLDDRQVERFIAEIAGRPTLIKGNTQLLYGGMGRLSEHSVLDIKNKSWAVTASVEVPAAGAQGVIIAQGGRFGGWSLYVNDGRARFHYNLLGIRSFSVDATEPVPTGPVQVRMEFDYDGDGMGKGGDVTLYYDGKDVGSGRVDQTQPLIFSADETTDVGRETGTTVSPDYTAHTSKFNGRIAWVQLDLGEDAKDADHYIDPDERFRVAMARQ
jgi:arylsulfatase